jgi:hypothetical protein
MSKRKTRQYETVGEMLDSARGTPLDPVLQQHRAAGAFRKPEGDDPNKGTRNPTNVGNPVPKGPSGSKQVFRNNKKEQKRARKLAQRNKSKQRNKKR